VGAARAVVRAATVGQTAAVRPAAATGEARAVETGVAEEAPCQEGMEEDPAVAVRVAAATAEAPVVVSAAATAGRRAAEEQMGEPGCTNSRWTPQGRRWPDALAPWRSQ